MADNSGGMNDAEFGLPAPASVAPVVPNAGDQDATPARLLTIKSGNSGAPRGMTDAQFGLAPRNAQDAATSGAGPLANTQDDTWTSGGLKGAATAAIKGVGHIIGQVGDTQNLADLLAAGASSLWENKPASQIYNEIRAQNASGKNPGLASPGNVLPSGNDISAPILKQTGEYTPTSTVGRLGQAGVEAAVGGLGAGSGAAAEGAAGRAIIGQTIKQAPLNATAGVAGQGATDATGNPYLGVLSSLVAPSVAHTGFKVAGNVASPAIEDIPGVGRMFAGQREANVGNQLIHDASNPQAAKDWAATGVLPNGESNVDQLPGPSPTTGSVLGDPKLLGKQRDMLRDPNSGMLEFQQGQNDAQRAGIQSIAPDNAQTMLPSQMLSDKIDALRQATDLAQQKIAQRAVAGASPLTTLPNPEEVGTKLRGGIQVLHDQERSLTNKMYDEADPAGVVRADPTNVTDKIKSIQDSVDPLDSDITGPEKQLYDTWNNEVPKMAANGTIPYKSLIAFDRNLNSVLPDATKGARSRLTQLKSAVMDTLNNSLDGQNAVDQQAVAAGQMAPEDALEARMRQAWNVPNARSANSAGNVARPGAGSVGFPGSGQAVGARPNGAGLQEAGVVSASAGNPGIPQASTPGSAATAAGKLAAAKQQYIKTATTYDQGPVGSALSTNGYKGQYDTPASALPGKAFVKGPTGYETAKAFLKAGQNSPETIEAMTHAALYPLKDALNENGMVTPTGLAKYKQAHAQALRAMEEVSPGFSSQFDTPAKATEAAVEYGLKRQALLDQFQKSAGAKLIGKTDPIEAQNEILAMIKDGKNGPTKLRQLMNQVKGNTDAEEGIRGLARDALLSQLSNASEAGVSGNKKVSNAGLDTLVKKGLPALQEIFPKDAVNRILQVAHSAELNNRDVTAGTIKASAADRARDIVHGVAGSKITSGMAHAGAGLAVWEAVSDALHTGHFGKALATGAGVATLAALNKLRSGGVNTQHVMYDDAIKNPLLAQRYITKAVSKGDLETKAQMLTGAIQRSIISAPISQDAARKRQTSRYR